MARLFEFRQRSVLRASSAEVWRAISTMQGVNAELWPLARMTVPLGWEDRSLDDASIGERAFRSWVLLFGVIPFDRHDLTLVAVDAGWGFHEHSSSLLQAHWIHRLHIIPQGQIVNWWIISPSRRVCGLWAIS